MKETFKNLKLVYKNYGKEQKWALIRILLFSLFGLVTSISLPLLSAKFIVYFTDSAFKQAVFMALIVLVVYILESFKILFIRKNNQIFKRATIRNIQMSLGREILKLEQSTLDSNSSGVFIQRLTNDTEKMAQIFTGGMVSVIQFLSGIGSFIAILIIDYHMFLYYLLASIILTILNYVKQEKVGKKEIEYRKICDKVAGLTGELVRGAKDIKMLYAKDSFMANLDENIVIQNEKNFETRNVDMKYNLIIDIIKVFLELGGVLFIIYLIINNIFTVAIGLALYNYRTTVLTNFMRIVSTLFEECKNFNISTARVFSIINKKEFKKENFGQKHISKVMGNFEFKNVSFGYNKKLVLNNLNFRINNGETIGFVGKSGTGKTTIFNLLCKLYDINEGKILIDGININDLDEESIRGNITIISQNPYIFNMSIRDNFKLVKKDLTEEDMINACHMACLDEFIESMPNKYDTVIGEGGVNLSGGQGQRLAIARALVQKTKIILFDEATSALDNETQNKIQQAIDNLKGEYTIMIIAHRLSTIVNTDKIYFLQEGKILASGTHKELLKKCKEYRLLYETEIKNAN